MPSKGLTAAVALALTCALVGACLQTPTPGTDPGEAQRPNGAEPIGEAPQDVGSNGAEPIGEAQQAAGGAPYVSKNFRFKVVLKDDGKDPGGGWQAAEVSDAFTGGPLYLYRWECHYKVEMPIRTEAIGRITAARAALWSAEAANEVVFPLLDSTPDWTGLGVVFCQDLYLQLAARLNAEHPGLGAKVEKDQ